MELPKVKVADFEGPFDLLLHLIKKNKKMCIRDREYTVFNALGKSYESSKNIYELNEGDKIQDDMNGYPHVQGEYKEIDFAIDLLTEYLHKNSEACLLYTS